MALPADPSQLANRARRLYTDELVKGLPEVIRHVVDMARHARDKPSDYQTAQRRRDLAQSLHKSARPWLAGLNKGLMQVLEQGGSVSLAGSLANATAKGLTLVDDDTIDREILTSRLALAIMDRASWEFSDLRSRVASLERRQELGTHDMLRAHVLARVVLEAWHQAGLSSEGWRECQAVLHDEFALLVEEAYHETNRWLISQKVLPDIDLRPFIRRTVQGVAPRTDDPLAGDSGPGPTGYGAGPGRGGASDYGHMGGGGGGGVGSGQQGSQWAGHTGPMPSRPALMRGVGRTGGAQMSGGGGWARPSGRSAVGEETRLMTRAAPLARGSDHAEAVMGRLNRLVGRHLPGFADTAQGPAAVTPRLSRAIDMAQHSMRQRLGPVPMPSGGVEARAPAITTPMLLDDLQHRKQILKQAAETPAERATIEIVAMMFQSILAEERIPAQVRVWFARLQMPVLRVAVSEPDFFATIDHPARRLIDRMGACVMGFDDTARAVGDALEKEIKRIVQVVEAYPDTGRRVFQTVLAEFEKFLEHFFRTENEATRRGVSLAQQVEQRETLAIQYTIELRRMLNEVPVQEGVRQFLFHVWADVLATTAVRYGGNGEETKQMKRAAADLIWSASAKVTREERGEVIRRLPPLLKRLREGMASAGMGTDRQDEQIQALNNSLAAAFTAKAAVIPTERLTELMERLESLEELLPQASDLEIDESIVLDLSGHESSELEVVSDGGSMPSPAMLSWARELMVGSWYMLDYRDRTEPVQLAWHGMRRQLSLFVSANGRCVLFQQHRLASYLQAGLLLPAQEESLTVKATRSALAKLDADPSRLMN
ncbi:DUF1631 family protein [Ideonella sp. A 288]|uniref:DUF1631 family protein n=1 Tax=Ideonella sp. A 288 TaxID=1962181 RepID=UPI000B4BF735|nr:DUF1631 family protein [Ideonella sp. A 288]